MKIPAILITAAFLAAAVPAQAHEAHEHHDGEHVGPRAAYQLEKARTATKRFRTPAAAKAAGYVFDTECVADPAAGGMGVHAFNENLMADASTDDRPRLFGRRFDGPVSGPGDAPIYLLHGWVHKRNPSGMFAPFNPRVDC